MRGFISILPFVLLAFALLNSTPALGELVTVEVYWLEGPLPFEGSLIFLQISRLSPNKCPSANS